MSKCVACGYDSSIQILWRGRLVVPTVWPSVNHLKANIRGRGGVGYRKYKALFLDSVPQATGHEVARSKRRVWFTRFYGARKREYDYANLVGGGKALVDVLVSKGWLLDDNPKVFEAYYDQRPSEDKTDWIDIQLQTIG